MKNEQSYLKEKKRVHLMVSSSYITLKTYRKEGNKQAFNELLLKIIPELRRFIKKQLITAIRKGHFSKNKYKPDDIVDQLFIEVYDHFDQIKHKDDLYPWLFSKAEALMTATIANEEFEHRFKENIDTLSQPEWKEMEENFSTDGDGDLVMIDELDDLSYPKNDYTLDQVLIEDQEKELIEKLDRKLKDERIQKHIDLILYNLPSQIRSVFELFTIENFSLDQIASIKGISQQKAKHLLHEAKKSIQVGILNRFSD